MNQLNVFQPFTLTQASQAGLTRSQLESNDYRVVAHGLRISAAKRDDLLLRCRVIQSRLSGDHLISHHSAALLWGGSVPLSSRVHVAIRGQRHLVRDDVQLHRFVYDLDADTHRGVRLTTPTMTFGHMARELELLDLIAFGDGLVRHGRTSPAALVEAMGCWPGQKRRLALMAASQVRDGVDSVPETRLRMLLRLAGLPEPQVNITFANAEGEVVRRIELGYPEAHLGIEYDGAWHRLGDQPARDQVRREFFESIGWTIITVDSSGLYDDPEATVARIRRELADRSMPLRRRTSDAWRRHFRVRVAA